MLNLNNKTTIIYIKNILLNKLIKTHHGLDLTFDLISSCRVIIGLKKKSK